MSALYRETSPGIPLIRNRGDHCEAFQIHIVIAPDADPAVADELATLLGHVVYAHTWPAPGHWSQVMTAHMPDAEMDSAYLPEVPR